MKGIVLIVEEVLIPIIQNVVIEVHVYELLQGGRYHIVAVIEPLQKPKPHIKLLLPIRIPLLSHILILRYLKLSHDYGKGGDTQQHTEDR